MKAPENPCDISREWVEFVLNDYEYNQEPPSTVFVNRFSLSSMDNILGDGFTGKLVNFKMDVMATLTTENKSEMKEYYLMVKLKDMSSMNRETDIQINLAIKEMKMYKEVIPELNRFAKSRNGDEYCLDIPKIIYGKCTGDEFVLVLENLNFQGFYIQPIESRLNYSQISMVVKYLAKLHALSYSYDKRNNFLERFPCYKNNYMTDLFYSFANNRVLKNVKKLLHTMKGADDLLQRIESMEETQLNDYDNGKTQISSESPMCLTHTDICSNNIMLRYSKLGGRNEIVKGIQVLNWQRSHWNTAIFDLHYFLYTSTSHKFRKDYLDEILQQYHTLFTRITKKMGVAKDWTYEDFKAEYSRLRLMGVLQGLMLTQFSLSEQVKQIQTKSKAQYLPNITIRSILGRSSKILTTLKLPNPVKYLFQKFTKYLFGVVGKELVNGNNLGMRERVLDIVCEADNDGLFG